MTSPARIGSSFSTIALAPRTPSPTSTPPLLIDTDPDLPATDEPVNIDTSGVGPISANALPLAATRIPPELDNAIMPPLSSTEAPVDRVTWPPDPPDPPPTTTEPPCPRTDDKDEPPAIITEPAIPLEASPEDMVICPEPKLPNPDLKDRSPDFSDEGVRILT